MHRTALTLPGGKVLFRLPFFFILRNPIISVKVFHAYKNVGCRLNVIPFYLFLLNQLEAWASMTCSVRIHQN